jgi:hypothetical protein
VKILQRQYLLPIIYEPEKLRQKVIEIYGFDRFKQYLSKLLLNQF